MASGSENVSALRASAFCAAASTVPVAAKAMDARVESIAGGSLFGDGVTASTAETCTGASGRLTVPASGSTTWPTMSIIGSTMGSATGATTASTTGAATGSTTPSTTDAATGSTTP